MTLKSQIETAKDVVSKVLITALENKNEYVIGGLFNCYNTLNTLRIKEYKIEIGNKRIYDKKYDSHNISLSSIKEDTISFDSLD